MVVAMTIRFVGWVIYVKGWISGTSDRLSLMDAVFIGVPKGWAIASPMLATSGVAIGIIAAFCVILLVVPLLVARVARHSQQTVFISYHNSKQELALRLSQVLALNGFGAQFLPFDPVAEHDELLRRIDQALATSQFVVCFPGDQPSFVEAEVLAAAAASKSIVFVVDYPEGRIPNTAAKTYPVVTTQGVVTADFEPLVELLRYLYGGWKETLTLYFLPNAPVDSLKRLNDMAIAIVFTCVGLLFFMLWFGGLTAFALEYFFSESFKVSVMVILFAGMFCLIGLALTIGLLELLTNAVSGIVRRQRAATAARQAIRSGNCTDAMLRSAFAPAALETSKVGFLAVLWPNRPLAHHEAGTAPARGDA